MGNQVLTLEAANLFAGANPSDADASNHLIITELKLPGLDEQYVDHRSLGAPVSIEINTVFAKLESTFILLGWTPQVATLVGSWAQADNKFSAYGVIRDRQSGETMQAIAVMWGRLGRADPQNWRRGDSQHWNYAIKGINHYELYIAGDPIYYWDYFSNTLQIGGEDVNADLNALLFTGVTQAPQPVVSGLTA